MFLQGMQNHCNQSPLYVMDLEVMLCVLLYVWKSQCVCYGFGSQGVYVCVHLGHSTFSFGMQN